MEGTAAQETAEGLKMQPSAAKAAFILKHLCTLQESALRGEANQVEEALTLPEPSQILERETGIEPATNGLGSRYSTIELLPLTATRLFYP
jgi:hypothetical protein